MVFYSCQINPLFLDLCQRKWKETGSNRKPSTSPTSPTDGGVLRWDYGNGKVNLGPSGARIPSYFFLRR
jgi:hypothetical protein